MTKSDLEPTQADNGLVGLLEALAGDCDAGEDNDWEDHEWRDAAALLRRAAQSLRASPASGEATEGGVDDDLNGAVVSITQAAIMRMDADEDNTAGVAAFERRILPILAALRTHSPKAEIVPESADKTPRRNASPFPPKAEAIGEGAEVRARMLAARIMAAVRNARFPKEYPAEAHDEFESLTLTPMLQEALRIPSQANDAAGQGEVDTRVLAEAAMAKARDEYHELYGAELRRLREALDNFVYSLTSDGKNRDNMLTIDHAALTVAVDTARAVLASQGEGNAVS